MAENGVPSTYTVHTRILSQYASRIDKHGYVHKQFKHPGDSNVLMPKETLSPKWLFTR